MENPNLDDFQSNLGVKGYMDVVLEMKKHINCGDILFIFYVYLLYLFLFLFVFCFINLF